MVEQPNIIFLMTDQQRWDALGCVDPVVQTPNLDRLANAGIRFEQAICNNPMCVPSRYSMMTGLYSSQSGLRHNTQMCPTDVDLPVPVLPEMLHDLGYQTAGFGKTHWYIGSHISDDMAVETSTRGFEVRAQARPNDPKVMEPGALNMQLDAPASFNALSAETKPYGGGGESILGYTGCTSGVEPTQHREGWLTKQALEFLNTGRDDNRPLFLYLSFDFPHAGFNVPAGYEDRYDIADIPDRPHPPWDAEPAGHALPRDVIVEEWQERSPEERRQTTLRYYALCSYVDDLFGFVLDKLEALGELENSLIAFVSDHGEMLGDRFHRFSKYCLYEGSVRVPFILSGSVIDAVRRGTVDRRNAELVDLLPTLQAAGGGSPSPHLPGLDLLDDAQRPGAFAEMHGKGYEAIQVGQTYMWRTPEWKLILHMPVAAVDAANSVDMTQGELYDLLNDPYEWVNLYEDPMHLAIREQLTRDLLIYLAGTWAKYPFQPARARLTN